MGYSRGKDVAVYNSAGTLDSYSHRVYEVQRKPYKKVQPLSSYTLSCQNYRKNWFGNVSYSPGVGSLIDLNFPGDKDQALNRAYAKFSDAVRDTAQNANNLLEIKGNFQAIVSHVTALTKAAAALKRGDVLGAAKALGGKPLTGSQKSKIYKALKKPADAWLEYHFGWEPLVQDIGTSIDAIQGTGKVPPNSKYRVTGKGAHQDDVFTDLTHDYGGGLTDSGAEIYNFKTGVRMAALVSVSNPNVALANQMGFVNPLSVVWEAVPFSFVVDWFSNVGQCVSAMNDFAGFNLEQEWNTVLERKTRTYSLLRQYAVDPVTHLPSSGFEAYQAKAIRVTRGAVIPGPKFHFSLPKPFGASRSATAISLLVQQLNKLRK